MVAEKIHEAVAAAAGQVDFTVERPKQAEHGDYATNVALVLAKRERKNPREVAEQLQGKLAGHELFESVEVAGPGFLNFRVAPVVWQNVLSDILEQQTSFGTLPATGKKIQLEFISGNPTGPLTLGNGRGGFGGDILANVLAKAGHEVEREYYINDSGNQILTLGRAIKGEEDAYKGPYVDELRQQLDLTADAATVGHAAANSLMAEIRKTIERMNIRFDGWFSERSELHDQGKVDSVLDDLRKAGHVYDQDGAVWLKTSEHGDDKDRVLKKSDGSYTYIAADLAYHLNKLAVRGFDRAINIWGADHHGDVKRLQVGVELMREQNGFTGELVILLTQLVRLVRNGQEVKMSKRAGTYVTLDELFDEIPVDVARFFFVMRSFDTHMDFDLDLAKEQSPKNPVYYLKYAHARTASIIRKAGTQPAADLAKLTDPAEHVLIRELSEFPTVIAETAADYQLHRIPHYALGLADTFHKFYEQCQVITEDAELTAARVELVRGTKVVLQNVGETLGIEMPEEM